MPGHKKITVCLTPLQLAALYEAAVRALHDSGHTLPGRQTGATRRGALALGQAYDETGEEWPLL